MATPLHVSDALPRGWRARSPPLKSTADTIKTKQNAHRPPNTARPTPTDKLAPIPSTCKPCSPLAGLRCPSPCPSRPCAVETAPRGGPSWEVARHRSEGAALNPEILEVKERPQKSARAEEGESNSRGTHFCHWRTFVPSLMFISWRTFFTPLNGLGPHPTPTFT